jgi:hypothetical protein
VGAIAGVKISRYFELALQAAVAADETKVDRPLTGSDLVSSISAARDQSCSVLCSKYCSAITWGQV